MKHLHLAAPCIAALLLCMACNKDPQIEEVFFEFEMPFTITPGTDTVRVGDTLRMEANFSDTLFDYISKKKYHVPGFQFNNIIASIRKLTDSSKQIIDQSPAVSLFKLSSYNDQLNAVSNGSIVFSIVSKPNSYFFSIDLIPKQTGVYAIWLFNGFGRDGGFMELPNYLVASAPDIRRIPVARQHSYIWNNGNSHYEILKQNCKTFSQTADSSMERRTIYTFVVK
jgi:hypothetical protein